MVRNISFLFFVVGLFLCFAKPIFADPLQQTKKLIDTFQQVIVKEKGKSLSHDQTQSNEQTFKKLDEYFDYLAITRSAIAGFEKKFSQNELNEYHTLFTNLIRLVAYPNTKTFFEKSTYKLSSEVKKQENHFITILTAHSKQENIDTEIGFVWLLSQKNEKIIDVTFDGDSLVQSYKNQFARIITKEQGSGLLTKLRSKYQELNKT